LTGSIREQIVLIAYGQGSNGKSTLLGILRRLFGDYACEADAESFMEKKSDAIREDIAALEGARFVAASETGDSKRLSEALVKKLTGGEHLRARRLYENGYEFLPQFKVWLSTNHKPEIHGTEHAIWRRIRLIPFDVTIPEGSRDKDFPAKLEAELPGILAWAVRGCLDWQQDGEQPPESVTDATSAYRREMDIIGNWLDDRCELRPGVRETPKALYDDYVSYCETTGETPIKQRTFGMKLTARGCGEEKSNNVRYRTGIRLSDPDHHEQATFETGTQGTQGTDVSGNFPSNASTRDLPESYVPYVPCVPVKNAASDEFVEVEI
jgi:putative DNA primase/helicase